MLGAWLDEEMADWHDKQTSKALKEDWHDGLPMAAVFTYLDGWDTDTL